jgi:hypothetical protein
MTRKNFAYFLPAAMISIQKNYDFDIMNCNKLKAVISGFLQSYRRLRKIPVKIYITDYLDLSLRPECITWLH